MVSRYPGEDFKWKRRQEKNFEGGREMEETANFSRNCPKMANSNSCNFDGRRFKQKRLQTVEYFSAFLSRIKDKPIQATTVVIQKIERIKTQIPNSNISRSIRIFQNHFNPNFDGMQPSLQSFLYDTFTLNVAEVRKSHLWTTSTQNCRIF